MTHLVRGVLVVMLILVAEVSSEGSAGREGWFWGSPCHRGDGAGRSGHGPQDG